MAAPNTKLDVLNMQSITMIQQKIARDFAQAKPSVLKEFFAGWANPVSNLFVKPTEEFSIANIKKIHDGYRFLVDNGTVPAYDGTAKHATVIAKQIEPVLYTKWAWRVDMFLKALQSLVGEGKISGTCLYPDVALAIDEQKAADRADKSIFDNLIDADKATKGIAAAGIVLLGIGGLYLYGMVTANRALSRWRNR